VTADDQNAPFTPEDLPELLKGILEDRGVKATDLRGFLAPSRADLPRPDSLPGIVDASRVILNFVHGKREIVVFGDYDCDGVCATAIAVRALEALQAKVGAFMPVLQDEGCGMSEASVARMLEEHPHVGLVWTVDNGINSVDFVARLRARGIAVVVTDHHIPGNVLPAANAVVDPMLSSPDVLQANPFCGAGVAFQLVRQLADDARRRELAGAAELVELVAGNELLILAGLATVTDVMPLVGPNRVLVSVALRHFRSEAPVGLQELLAQSGDAGSGRLFSRTFGFLLGPRINAAGRLSSGIEALSLLLERDRAVARSRAQYVETLNLRRKQIARDMFERAREQVVPGASAQVIDLSDGNPAVAGIVAARLLDALGGNVPVCVFANDHGSARAPEGFNLLEAFMACESVLGRYGGHAAAAGFSVLEGQAEHFRELLCAYCDAHGTSSDTPRREGMPHRWVMPHDFTRDGWLALAEAVAALEPFGEGNAMPVFGFHNVLLSEVKTIAGGRHLQVVIAGTGLRAVFWNRGDLVLELRRSAHLPRDIVFTLGVSDYGERHAELNIVSV